MHTAAKIIPRPQVISKYFNASIVALLAPQRFCPDFTGTVCRTKNRRKTCPKISSSASNATANEKSMPPTTATNVITICIMSPQNRAQISYPQIGTRYSYKAGQKPNFISLSAKELMEYRQTGRVGCGQHCVRMNTFRNALDGAVAQRDSRSGK